ncbi:hypothetical protein D3C85_1496170 [compost metagenome]
MAVPFCSPAVSSSVTFTPVARTLGVLAAMVAVVTVGTYRGAGSLTKVEVLSSLVSDELFLRIDMTFS